MGLVSSRYERVEPSPVPTVVGPRPRRSPVDPRVLSMRPPSVLPDRRRTPPRGLSGGSRAPRGGAATNGDRLQQETSPTDAARHQSVRIVVLAPREVGMLVGVVVPWLALLSLGEVTTPRLMDARVTSLLALREVAAMLLLGRLGRLLLARGEATVVVVVGVIVMIAVLVVAVLMVMTMIVVGMLAHVPWVSQRFL
jgi:hypothetical protein